MDMNKVTPAVVMPVMALGFDPSSFKLIIPNTSASIASVSDIAPEGKKKRTLGSVMHIEIMPKTIDAVAIISPLLLSV